MHKTATVCLAIGFFVICGIIGLFYPNLGNTQSPERENFYQTIEEDALILKEQNGIDMHMKTIPQVYKIFKKHLYSQSKNYPKQIPAELENKCANDNTTSVCDTQRRKDSENKVVIITKDGRMLPVTDKESQRPTVNT